jgi:hypothetical protein
MAVPLVKLLLFAIGKKVAAFTIAKIYGVPKLYRRFSEVNRRLLSNRPEMRARVQNALSFSFRLPSRIINYITNRK